MALGDTIGIDDRTVLVLGQELDVEGGQPDVANALLHRVDDTLFLVDTGVTERFRDAVTAAVDRVGPWQRLVVLTTHGHVDHVGNNDLADDLAQQRGVPVEHHLPARDLPQLLDPESYWVQSFSRIAGVVPLPAPPRLVGDRVVSLFQPLRPFGLSTRTYEQRPLERIRVGSQRMTGWTFADGAVRVLRTQGHCAGHVVVHLRDNRLLHLSDEGNGPCGVMHDADQFKLQAALGAVAAMVDEGEVTTLTDGHSFEVADARQAADRVDALLEQAMILQERALTLLPDRGPVHPGEWVEGYAGAVAELEVGGANPNAYFTGMMAVNQLRELGLRPDDDGAHAAWRRPDLVTPRPPAGTPRGLALVPAAVSMAAWKIRRRDR
ncbi:MBL fold metallo-hydrolase [Nakamurella endophytica]|uniref:Metallo-beta-lactamase domain-containing protein n=1 Tax=Nakamurella endophytica TaxID=1748367 RepID=A0A917WM72_9ACTN|nr:MBL fold metallo-hydrolase [Nakamurella endophytica]GGM13803.1 hypothetical protein GCM10011594_37110 [Nakamurella endophytica]